MYFTEKWHKASTVRSGMAPAGEGTSADNKSARPVNPWAGEPGSPRG